MFRKKIPAGNEHYSEYYKCFSNGGKEAAWEAAGQKEDNTLSCNSISKRGKDVRNVFNVQPPRGKQEEETNGQWSPIWKYSWLQV